MEDEDYEYFSQELSAGFKTKNFASEYYSIQEIKDNQSYGQYSGTYAQDEEGLSDDFIDDVLGGEPDEYWNID